MSRRGLSPGGGSPSRARERAALDERVASQTPLLFWVLGYPANKSWRSAVNSSGSQRLKDISFQLSNPKCWKCCLIPFHLSKKKKKSCKHNFFYGWPLYITAWRLMASHAINLPQSSAQLFICHSVIFLPLSPHLCQGFWFNHPKNTLFPIFPFQNATVFFRR